MVALLNGGIEKDIKAIITAAGEGSRMYPLAQDIPKCMLPFHNETILGRQIRILRSCGILDITVVVGFRKEVIIDKFGDEVSIEYNPQYKTTNSLFSLWVVRSILTDDMLILNADGVFDEKPIRALIADKHIYVIGVDNKNEIKGDARKVRVMHNLVVVSSHILPIWLTCGEVAGMAKIKKEGIREFRKSMFQMDKRDSKVYWPDTFNHLINQGFKVHYILVDTPWMNINTKEDYEEAKKLQL